LTKLEQGNATSPALDRAKLDEFLRSHYLDPALLRADDIHAFMADRQKRLLALIEEATGKAAYVGAVEEEGEDIEVDEDTIEAKLTTAES
jgi:hypothetical protein